MKSAKMMTAKGTVMKMDKDAKMMTMKSSKGKEMTMYWDDSTKVMGDMKEGSMATVHYMMHDGKMMAHDSEDVGRHEERQENVSRPPDVGGRRNFGVGHRAGPFFMVGRKAKSVGPQVTRTDSGY